MNRFFVFLFLFFFSVHSSFGQGMSDSQVMQYVERESRSGASQSQIAMRLMQRGVTMQQLQRVRSEYERRGGVSLSDGSASDGSLASSRLREPNGSVRVDAQGNELSPRSSPSSSDGPSSSAAGSRPGVYVPDTLDNRVNGRRVFGRDIFNRRLLSFEPPMNIATPSDYVLGAGDRVVIDVYGASQKSQQLEVSPDGTVVVEGFGPIRLAGLTVDAANRRLREQLGSRYSSSSVRLTVGQTRTVTVSVMGEVAVPGTYVLSAFAGVFHALYMAGGVSGIGTLRDVKVYRGGRELTSVDVYDYILNGRLRGDVRLADGDAVVVGPYRSLVSVAGQVRRPMAYEMLPGESVATLLRYAGGLSPRAYRGSVRVSRVSGDGHSAFGVPEFEQGSFALADGDSVTVDSVPARYVGTVEVRGAVFHPGMYDLGSCPSVGSLVRSAGGLREDAFTVRAVLRRMGADRVRRVIPVDLGGILSGEVADVPLGNEDVLSVPTLQERMAERTVTIGGEVQFPGVYEYAEGGTVEDFILLAGGLTDAASTARVDVSRRIVDPSATSSGGRIAETYSVTLADGFSVGGGGGFTLEPYDEVYVRRSPGYQVQRGVTVDGEVLFGGRYALREKSQRLSDAVRAAGGLTPQAYVKGARLERVLNADERFRVESLLRMVRRQSGSGLDTSRVTGAADSVYYVGIELDRALAHPGSDFDLVLREGDRLVIPEYNGTVRINGNVMYPNTVAYSKGRKLKWYVNQAGGYGSRAKRSRTYVLYPNGTVSRARRGTRIDPGCEIIVPTRTTSTQDVIGQIGSLGTSMATIVTLLVSVMNLVK